MEHDLISRSALIGDFDVCNNRNAKWTPQRVSTLLVRAPSVDAVEVVRCKDCKHWNEDALACDTLPWVNSSEHANWYAEDFCSYGERRADDG